MTSTLAAEGLTADAFLGGRLTILQPIVGYRAAVDPVLLAASVTAQPGQSVLDLGCGAGVAALCLGTRIAGLSLAGVEVQEPYADLARRNAAASGIAFDVHIADIRSMPPALRARSFDHVLMNPPYFNRQTGTPAADAGRDLALGGETPLSVWVDAATRRLAPSGWFWAIQRTARLPEMLGAIDPRLGSVTVQPLAARTGRAADLFLLRARKGGRAAFRLLAPLALHEGDRHLRDGDDFAPGVRAVLRDGAALDWSD